MLNERSDASRQMLYFYGYSGEIIDFQRDDYKVDVVSNLKKVYFLNILSQKDLTRKYCVKKHC